MAEDVSRHDRTSYLSEYVSHREDELTYVSRPKKAIRRRTNAPYMEPIPYAHLQLTCVTITKNASKNGETDLALATRNPNANGEREGEMRKPVVQILSYIELISFQ